MGTSIKLTRRAYVENVVIQLHYYVVQYLGCLKTERYNIVQVVLLMFLTISYQGMSYEDERRYGDRDISKGSLVFGCSKDNRASDRPLPLPSTNQNFLTFYQKLKSIKEKCLSRFNGSCPLSYELFVAIKGPKPNMIFVKNLYGVESSVSPQG